MNAKLIRHALVLTSIFAAACDDGDLDEPEIQHFGSGYVLLSDAEDFEVSHRDASVFVDLPDAGTQAWEPGNGYFERNDEDPQTQIYYSSCDESAGSPASSEAVQRVLVDADAQSLLFSTLVTFVPDIDGVTVINAATGLPLAAGDELDSQACDYSSSYAHCETENVAFDFTAIPFPGPPIDAQLINTVESHMYWDHGQDRFRVLRYGQTGCEGTSCTTHPFVVNFLSSIGATESCESWGMTVYDRVPTPAVE